jgi:hypothetical protein
LAFFDVRLKEYSTDHLIAFFWWFCSRILALLGPPLSCFRIFYYLSNLLKLSILRFPMLCSSFFEVEIEVPQPHNLLDNLRIFEVISNANASS